MSTSTAHPPASMPWFRLKGRSLLLPIIAAASLGYMAWHMATSIPQRPAVEPHAQPPRSSFSRTVAGAGLIEPRSENIEVAAVMPGVVVEVQARVGQIVEAGDLLFRLDDRQRRADLAVQSAGLARAEAELARWEGMPRTEDLPASAARVGHAQADLRLREDQLERARRLFPDRVVTEQELVAAEQAYSAAKAALTEVEAEDALLRAGAWEADLVVARSAVEQARELVSQAQVEIDRLAIRAPIRGTVLKVDVRPGEYVGTPADRALVVLGDIEVLHVRVDIDENDLPRFHPGMPGRGFVRGDAEQAVPLRFVRVEPLAQPKRSLTGAGNERIDTRVLQAIYAIDASSPQVYVGQQVDVFLDGEAKTTPTQVSKNR